MGEHRVAFGPTKQTPARPTEQHKICRAKPNQRTRNQKDQESQEKSPMPLRPADQQRFVVTNQTGRHIIQTGKKKGNTSTNATTVNGSAKICCAKPNRRKTKPAKNWQTPIRSVKMVAAIQQLPTNQQFHPIATIIKPSNHQTIKLTVQTTNKHFTSTPNKLILTFQPSNKFKKQQTINGQPRRQTKTAFKGCPTLVTIIKCKGWMKKNENVNNERRIKIKLKGWTRRESNGWQEGLPQKRDKDNFIIKKGCARLSSANLMYCAESRY